MSADEHQGCFHTYRRIPVHGILSMVACMLIGLMAAQPFLYGNLPFGADTLLHLFRAVQLDELVKQGVWYSRWSPDLALGYGYPLFNYYAPGVYYLVEVLHLLGLDFVQAFMGASTVLLIAAALCTYRFARDLTSSAGALVAAAAYTCAPYMILMTVHTGSISQVAAMAILPAVFWAFRRLTTTEYITSVVTLVRKNMGFILVAAIAFAALMLSHNITSLLAAPFLVLYVGVTSLHRQPSKQFAPHSSGFFLLSFCISCSRLRLFAVKSLLLPALAIALGLGLTAFYWLPVLTETSLVQLDRTIIGTAFDFHANFVTVADLFAVPHTYDPRLIGESLPYAFSLPVVTVAVVATSVVGVIVFLRRRIGEATLVVDWVQVAFAIATVLLCIFLATPASQSLWDAVPMMRFVQFPTRILTIASLFLAVLAGIGIGGSLGCGFRGGRGLVILLVLIFAVYAFFWQNITRYPSMPQMTMSDFTKYERENGWIGTTSLGEYLPATVRSMPEQTVVGQTRFSTASLPPGTAVLSARSNALDHMVTVDSAVPWIAEFNVFMFPGWVAEVDGHVAPITVTELQGLIHVAVPSGLHDVAIYFRETPARAAADALSISCAVLGIIGVGMTLFRRKQSVVFGVQKQGSGVREQGLEENERVTGMSQPEKQSRLWLPLSTGMALFFLLVIKTAMVDTQDTLFYRSRYDGARVSGARQDFAVSFGQRGDAHTLDLIGVDAPESSDTSSDASVTLYWRTLQPSPENLSVGVEMADSQGNIVGRSDHPHPAGFPLIRWDAARYAADEYRISLKPGTPPGIYTFKVSVYRYDKPVARLPAFDKNGQLTGTTFDSMAVSVITTTEVTAPSGSGIRVGVMLTPQNVLNTPVNQYATLLGFDLPVTSLSAGERLPLTAYWRAGGVATEVMTSTKAALPDWHATWVLARTDGSWSTEINTEAIVGYPTSQWVASDTWRAPHALLIPVAAPAGSYRLSIRAQDGSELSQGDADTIVEKTTLVATSTRSASWPTVFLAEIMISAPEHVLTLPAIAYTQAARFNDAVELVGYDILSSARAGDVVSVTLLWRAYAETEVRYKTFVHLVDKGDNRVTGVDSAPVNGTRPTSGWMAQEYIVDTRLLEIPKDLTAGVYMIKVGLYDERSLHRLLLKDGADGITLSMSLRVVR